LNKSADPAWISLLMKFKILHDRRPFSQYLSIIQLQRSDIAFRIYEAKIATVSGEFAPVVDSDQFKLQCQLAQHDVR